MVVTNHQAGNDKVAQKTAIDKHKAINTGGEMGATGTTGGEVQLGRR